MAKNISVSEESVTDLIKVITQLLEDTKSLVGAVNKSIDNAEMDGWNDQKLITFKDDFSYVERNFSNGILQIDNVLIPELKKIQYMIESY